MPFFGWGNRCELCRHPSRGMATQQVARRWDSRTESSDQDPLGADLRTESRILQEIPLKARHQRPVLSGPRPVWLAKFTATLIGPQKSVYCADNRSYMPNAEFSTIKPFGINMIRRQSFLLASMALTLVCPLVCPNTFAQTIAAFTASPSQEEGTTTHSFIGFGKATGIVIVGEDGQVEWQLALPASDGWMLESGNILAALYPCEKFPQGGVGEIDRKTKTFVWDYQGQQKEISTVQQIGENEFLVAELGDNPRAIVIDREGKILKEMPLACQKPNAHMQTRMLRMLPNGNYIAPHLLDFAVKEYEPATGRVVRTFPTDDRGREKRDWPFTAIRLENGNTVIGCTNGNRVIEVDSDGKIVWSVGNEDLGEDLIDDACGIQRLPNGNTMITSYHATGDKVKLTEVNRDKKIVWRFNGLKSGLHHFQILTTNGKPISPALK